MMELAFAMMLLGFGLALFAIVAIGSLFLIFHLYFKGTTVVDILIWLMLLILVGGWLIYLMIATSGGTHMA